MTEAKALVTVPADGEGLSQGAGHRRRVDGEKVRH
jgi:hypothetical protein